MKKLFCAVVTDFDGNLESPLIYHVRAESTENVEKHVREELVEFSWEENQIDDVFDIFIFEVRNVDIAEA